MTVTLINAFSMPTAETERFVQRWLHTAEVMAAQPGLVRARMYRSLDADGDPRFVNVADWSSGEAFTAATATPEFSASANAILTDPDLHVVARPVLYEVAYEIRPSSST